MKKEHAVLLISKLLEMADDVFCSHGCNDLPNDFFQDMTDAEVQELYREYHEWNGDPEEFDKNSIGYLGDSALMGYFSEYVKKI